MTGLFRETQAFALPGALPPRTPLTASASRACAVRRLCSAECVGAAKQLKTQQNNSTETHKTPHKNTNPRKTLCTSAPHSHLTTSIHTAARHVTHPFHPFCTRTHHRYHSSTRYFLRSPAAPSAAHNCTAIGRGGAPRSPKTPALARGVSPPFPHSQKPPPLARGVGVHAPADDARAFHPVPYGTAWYAVAFSGAACCVARVVSGQSEAPKRARSLDRPQSSARFANFASET